MVSQLKMSVAKLEISGKLSQNEVENSKLSAVRICVEQKNRLAKKQITHYKSSHAISQA